MNNVWLENYPEGVPHEIDPGAFDSIVEVFERSVRHYPNRPAFSNLGATLSYSQIDRLSLDFAAYCQKRLDLGKGDRLAIMMPNLLQYPVVLFGALRAGLAVVNTNPLYTARELRHQLSDSGTRAIVILENFASVLESCLDDTPVETVILTRMGDMLPFPKSLIVNAVVKHVKKMVPAYRLPEARAFKEILREGDAIDFDPPSVQSDDIAFLQYTGGTTGVSKGAVLTHRNMIANMLQAGAWIEDHVEKGEEVVITALPLYHIFALTANCLVFSAIGGLNHLITNPRDMPGFVRELGKTHFTAITGVNTLFNGLLNTPGFEDLDFRSLKIALGGGMSVQRDVAERWKRVTGCTLVEAYGLTEAAPAVCINLVDLEEFNGSVGLPVPSSECRVQDDHGNVLAFDEVGELYVRGPQVMKEYWNRPDETRECLSPDGWLRTGDIATMDEKGFVRIVDRKKDMIVVSGFNVYPGELEDIVAMHPGVLEVGAIGVEDPRAGEAVKLVVVRKDADLSVESLQEHCRKNLTAYKCPRHIQFVDSLPKSNVGKILRRELRALYGSPTS